MHGANYWFAMQTDAVPENHATRNRRVRRELPQVFKCCRGLYLMSMRARYRDGFRTAKKFAAALRAMCVCMLCVCVYVHVCMCVCVCLR